MPSLARLSLADELPAATTHPEAALRVVEPAAQVLLSATEATAADLLRSLLPALPATGRCSGDDPYALWQAPDRWLLVAESAGQAAALGDALSAVGPSAMASDLTDGLAVFDVEGPASRRVVQQAMTFDLGESNLPLGHAAATLFAGLRVTVYPWKNAARLRLHVERASARFVWDWLTTAASALD